MLFASGAALAVSLVAGLALPVLPAHLQQGLGLDLVFSVLVVATPFAVARLWRQAAWEESEAQGAKWITIKGLLFAAGSGLLMLGSLWFVRTPAISVAILLGARVLLGVGESFVLMAALDWAQARGGPRAAAATGAVLATTLYSGIAMGAPVGALFYGFGGLAPIGIAGVLLPLFALAFVLPQPAVVPAPPKWKIEGTGVVRSQRIALPPGTAVFDALAIVLVLLFAANGWQSCWTGPAVLGVLFVAPPFLPNQLRERIASARSFLRGALEPLLRA